VTCSYLGQQCTGPNFSKAALS